MRLNRFLVVLALRFGLNKSFQLDPDLVGKYFEDVNVKSGIIFYCDSSMVGSSWAKLARKFYLAFHNSNIRENVETNHLAFDNRPLGVVFDGNCGKAPELLDELSESLRFNISIKWIIFGDDLDQLKSLLNNRSVNIDSDITLALHQQQGKFLLYDYYAVSAGKIFISPKGFWSSEGKTIQFYSNRSRFDARSNLAGTAIDAGVVASRIQPHQTILQYLEGFVFYL